jgi:hypothetical protein
MSPADAHRRAKQLIIAALRIDPDLPEVRVSLAGIKRLFHRDWHGAEAECLRALHKSPNYAAGHQAYATLLAITDRVGEA